MNDTLFNLPPVRSVRDVPVGDFAGRARATDPQTSKDAALAADVATIRAAILAEFRRFGWLTDDEPVGELPELCEGSVKTARSGLKRDGLVVDSGSKRPSSHGRQMIVWKLASS